MTNEFVWRRELSPQTRRRIAGRTAREKWECLYRWLRNHNIAYQKRNPRGDYTNWNVVWFRTEDDARRFSRAWEQDAGFPGVSQVENAPEPILALSPGEAVLERHAARTARVVERHKRKIEKKKQKRATKHEQQTQVE